MESHRHRQQSCVLIDGWPSRIDRDPPQIECSKSLAEFVQYATRTGPRKRGVKEREPKKGSGDPKAAEDYGFVGERSPERQESEIVLSKPTVRLRQAESNALDSRHLPEPASLGELRPIPEISPITQEFSLPGVNQEERRDRGFPGTLLHEFLQQTVSRQFEAVSQRHYQSELKLEHIAAECWRAKAFH